ncbi:MAG: sigma 54-interacting transcriptional regulator, partial [Armatimonadota bacterium]|nr:sigma 54-interacting transcriptional regulator [Armatimonadota bacterium]
PVETAFQQVVFGRSAAMQAVWTTAELIAATNVPVLIQGESGTGKEVVAWWIHRSSPWAAGRFVRINCTAIPATLLESELFGYEKGAFTGADGSKPGWVELADGGSLLLDEIAELDPSLQPKLLYLLQDGHFSRIGGQLEQHVRVRVLCTTSRSLREEIESGNFRRDLFFRLNVVTIEVPPLRRRREDIPRLIDHFLWLYSAQYGRQAPPLSRSALRLLMHHHWPGNVRELENLIRRYVILGSEEAICSDLLGGKQVAPPSGTVSLKGVTRQMVREVERKLILETLVACHWNRREAARALNLSYRALFYKMKEVGLPGKRQMTLEDATA